jgi:hypothetical protein
LLWSTFGGYQREANVFHHMRQIHELCLRSLTLRHVEQADLRIEEGAVGEYLVSFTAPRKVMVPIKVARTALLVGGFYLSLL